MSKIVLNENVRLDGANRHHRITNFMMVAIAAVIALWFSSHLYSDLAAGFGTLMGQYVGYLIGAWILVFMFTRTSLTKCTRNSLTFALATGALATFNISDVQSSITIEGALQTVKTNNQVVERLVKEVSGFGPVSLSNAEQLTDEALSVLFHDLERAEAVAANAKSRVEEISETELVELKKATLAGRKLDETQGIKLKDMMISRSAFLALRGDFFAYKKAEFSALRDLVGFLLQKNGDFTIGEGGALIFEDDNAFTEFDKLSQNFIQAQNHLNETTRREQALVLQHKKTLIELPQR